MRRDIKADLWLLSVTVVWGTSFPIMSVALKHIGPYSFLALRYTLAAVLLFIYRYKEIVNIKAHEVKGGILVGLTLFFAAAFQTVGLLYTTPSKSGFITGVNVVLVPIFIAIIYKKLPDIKTIVGVAVSVLGLGLLSINGDLSINYGDTLTLFCAVFCAAQILLVDKYACKGDIFIITAIEMLVVGVLSFIPAIFLERLSFTVNPVTIGSILFTAVFCTIYAYVVQNKMQRFTKPTHAAVIFLAEPVFSALFSTFIGDKLTIKSLFGCALILFGMIIINIKGKTVVEMENEI